MTRFLIILICLVLAQTAPAATRYVSTNGASSTPPYDTWAKAATNIQDAVFAATNDVVLVTNGIYTCASSLSGSYRAMIIVTNSVTLRSVNGPAVTIVDGNNTGEFTNRCIYINNANVVVSGFTITNGRANAASPNNAGGGVFVGGNGLLTNCWILGNSNSNAPTPGGGGGIYLNNGGTVQNCTIAGNSATNAGGGIRIVTSGLVQDCLISNNIAFGIYGGGGGGVGMNGGTVSNCTIVENLVTNTAWHGFGGGVWTMGGTIANCIIARNKGHATDRPVGAGVCAQAVASIINCQIYNNTNRMGYGMGGAGVDLTWGSLSNCNIYGNNGGGVNSQRGQISNCNIYSNVGGGVYQWVGVHPPTVCMVKNSTISGNSGVGVYQSGGGAVRNCLIINNYSSGNGGGMGFFNQNGKTSLVENCTIVSNKANMGGGVYCEAGNYIDVKNSIIYSNTATTAGLNWYTNSTGVISFSDCSITPTNSLPGTDNITNYPLFMNPMANFRLTNSSPCVNRGTNQAWMDTGKDLDGRPRIDHFQSQGIVDMGAYEFFPSGTIVTMH